VCCCCVVLYGVERFGVRIPGWLRLRADLRSCSLLLLQSEVQEGPLLQAEVLRSVVHGSRSDLCRSCPHLCCCRSDLCRCCSHLRLRCRPQLRLRQSLRSEVLQAQVLQAEVPQGQVLQAEVPQGQVLQGEVLQAGLLRSGSDLRLRPLKI
jgi:hypothetical protein